MYIGVFEIPEGLPFPRTYEQMRRHMRAFAQSIDLDLKFAKRERSGSSYCDIILGTATVVESLGGKPYPIPETIHTTLHECSHWIDCHNGLFRDYYARRGYRYLIYPEEKDIRRLGVRAERHCEWQACRIMKIMYDYDHVSHGVYDDLGSAKRSLESHYEMG